MSRRTLILCLAVIAVLVLGVGAAVAFLYSGFEGDDKVEIKVSGDGKHSLLCAVPSDAVLVGCFDKARKAKLSIEGVEIPDVPVVVSMHYSGRLIPLYVFDMHRKPEGAQALVDAAQEKYLFAASQNGMILISESETLVRSSQRHLSRNVSILETPGFAEALSVAGNDDAVFIPNTHSDRLLSTALTRKLSSKAPFFESLADWTILRVEKSGPEVLQVQGVSLFDENPSEFMTVLEKSSEAVSDVASMLPSYTLFAASLPFGDVQPYLSAYQTYLDSRQELQRHQARQRELGSRFGIAPDNMFRTLEVREIATASFVLGSKVERVNLMKVGNCDVGIIFKGTDVKSLKKYVPQVHYWPYSSYAATSFGNLFALEDESCFTYIDGWIVTGSIAAIGDYVEKKALSYTLREYMKNAGRSDVMSAKEASFVSYFSFSEDRDGLSELIRHDALSYIAKYHEGCDAAPAELYVYRGKHGMDFDFTISKLSLEKTKAPEFERDTTVTIPGGPFKVKNSHTGKTNLFYQNSHNTLCLQDENGKDLWGVPFQLPLCGTVREVDYYANGKLQYAFGAGSKVYLIDRLSRFVKGFPVDLGKEILLGPDVYDFSGAGKYNIMVLHKDNTVQMYNLKGQKPSSWKGITSEHTIKGLPERIVVGSNNFWVVRTSVETLVFPFYGGDALTSFEGDRKIRPDSEVKVVDGTSISVQCYDGKQRAVKLK